MAYSVYTKSLLIYIVTFILLNSCQEKKAYLDVTYKGGWYETEFEYTFQSNGQFTFKANGHYGNTITKGKYAIIDSGILLHTFTDWDLQQGVLKPR